MPGVKFPRWIHESERCTSCGKVAKLVSHRINTDKDESFVEAHYPCECGNDNGIALTGGYVKAYQDYLDLKAKEDANGVTATVPPGPNG